MLMARIASAPPGSQLSVQHPPQNHWQPLAVRALLMGTLWLASAAVHAQPAWQPQRPVEIVVGSGGGNDRNARVLQKLEWVFSTAEWTRMMAADLQELEFRKSAATRDHLRQQYALTRTLLADTGVTN